MVSDDPNGDCHDSGPVCEGKGAWSTSDGELNITISSGYSWYWWVLISGGNGHYYAEWFVMIDNG